MSNIASGIKDYVLKMYHPDDPVDSILAFIAPGMLAASGFGWIAFIYEVAEVLGFDFVGFFSTIRQDLKELIQSLVEHKGGVSQDEIYSKVKSATTNAAQQHFNGEADMSKLPALALQAPNFLADVQDAQDVKSFAISKLPISSILKTAGIMSLFKGKLARLFIKMVSWLITSALIALGFAAAAGATKSLVGDSSSPTESDNSFSETSISPQAEQVMNMIRAKSISPDLTQTHANGIQNVWIESGDVDEVPQMIMGWIEEVYPDLKQHQSAIMNSTVMRNIIQLFNKRNAVSSGSGIIAFPKPFISKLDIINQIVGAFLNQNPNLYSA
jgi:hypothetical protein